MGDKPSYLGLLNAVAVAEAEAERYLDAWAEVTPRDDVRQVLRTVALREGEHGKAFAKRICELGYEVRPREDAGSGRRMAIASSTTLSDAEKFEQLGLGRPVEGDDIFAGFFKDQTIDIQTGALLGRYVAEERDSARLLRECCATLTADAAASNGHAAAPAADELADLRSRLDRIECLLEQLATKKASKAKSKKK